MTLDEHEALVRDCQAVVAEIQAHTSGCWAESLLPDLFSAYQQLQNAESWSVDRTCCARMLDRSYAETVRAEKAEATLDTLRNLLIDADVARDEAREQLTAAYEVGSALVAASEADLAASRALNTTLVAAAEEATAMVKEFLSPDDCEYDHNGGCQMHDWFGEGVCVYQRAREFVAARAAIAAARTEVAG